MPANPGRSDGTDVLPRAAASRSAVLPHVVTAVNGSDKVRTHFTFTNIGLTSVFSLTVDTIRQAEYAMDFEPINELRPGASLTCLAVIHPVINNDPHWTFEFWSDSGAEFETPFVVRYRDEYGRPIVMRNTLRWNWRRVYLVPDKAPEPG